MIRLFLVCSHTHHGIAVKIESKKYAEAEQMVSGDGLCFVGFHDRRKNRKTENRFLQISVGFSQIPKGHLLLLAPTNPTGECVFF